jgi:hypothetical protein
LYLIVAVVINFCLFSKARTSQESRIINQGVRQSCPLSSVLLNVYLNEVIREWLMKLKTCKYLKELIFNTLLFADDQFTIPCTEDNLQRAVYSLYNVLKYRIWKLLQKKTKLFGFVGTDHLRTKTIINDETLEQVNQFTYLGCSLSYQCSNDAEFKLAKF